MWEKIVLNLLSNAFKFTFSGQIEVALRQAGQLAELIVCDTGTGIPAEELPHLFERFHRVKGARGRTFEGSGIGLALVQELVRLHGGTIRVASEVDRGTTFTVSIPTGAAHLPADHIWAPPTLSSTGLRREAYVEEARRWLPDNDGTEVKGLRTEKASDLETQSSALSPQSSARILLADDNADMREYVRRLLDQAYEVVAVSDGAAALRAAREQAFDLVLTDVMMPEVDGVELLRALRADARTRELPVILLSARAGEEARVEGLEAGADDYLVKPFNASELLARVGARLAMARLRGEAARHQQALRESEERYRTLAEVVPSIVWTAAPDGTITYANERWFHYSGITPEQNAQRWPELVLHPDDQERCVQAWARALRDGADYEIEVRNRRYDGEYRWFITRAVPLRDSTGQITAWFGSTTDIHDQKQLEHDSHLLADIGERIRLATDANELLDQAAEMVAEYLAVRRCMIVEIDHAHDRGVVRSQFCRGAPAVAREYKMSSYSASALAEIAAGRTIVNNDSQLDSRTAATYEASYRPNGERAYIAVPLMRDGRWNGTLWVSDDVARQWQPREIALVETVAERVWLAVEKLRAEQALRANEERLQALYVQEQSARAQAEAASRLKDEFLATVSHELRTPLTSILGYGQIIQTRRRDEAYIVRTIEKIVRSAKAQAQLIDDLLDVSRIVTGKLRIEPRPIDMSGVIHGAIEALRPAFDARVIRLDTELHPEANTIVGDPNRLQQIVWNLLSNAVKFTPSGGTVRVRLEARDGQALLIVSDTGQGISPEFLPYVFDRFRQAESTSSRAHGGLGLGLAIVRHLVEMHGGTVQVESAGAGMGATFTVRLPLVAGAAAADSSALEAQDVVAPCPPGLEGVRVLLVDDQPDIVELLQDMLAPCGAVIRTATAARDALVLLRAWQPDVLVSDIAMPGEDGYWLIDSVRGLAPEQGGHIPAIALTAYVRVEDRMRVLAAGFQLYVPKPVEPAELLDAIARLAATHAAET
jgi:PAS domain S-box-containing protein